MKQREQTGAIRRKNAGQQGSPKHWRNYALMFVCSLLLVSGFFFAGRQHFSSMDYGMKNSKLRRQIDDLQAEKRRLLLAREVSLSPAEIKKAAKKAGLLDHKVEGDVARIAPATIEKALPQMAAELKPMVVKTAAVTPARPLIATPELKAEKISRPVKRTLAAE